MISTVGLLPLQCSGTTLWLKFYIFQVINIKKKKNKKNLLYTKQKNIFNNHIICLKLTYHTYIQWQGGYRKRGLNACIRLINRSKFSEMIICHCCKPIRSTVRLAGSGRFKGNYRRPFVHADTECVLPCAVGLDPFLSKIPQTWGTNKVRFIAQVIALPYFLRGVQVLPVVLLCVWDPAPTTTTTTTPAHLWPS